VDTNCTAVKDLNASRVGAVKDLNATSRVGLQVLPTGATHTGKSACTLIGR
jgi:hypothetical protein